MGDVGVGLQHIVRADASLAIFAGSAMNGHVFADQVFIADDYGAVFVFEFQILRVFADDSMRVDVISSAHAYILGNDSVGSDDGAITDFAIFADVGVWSDDCILMNDSTRMDDGGRMDVRLHGFHDFQFHGTFPFM